MSLWRIQTAPLAGLVPVLWREHPPALSLVPGNLLLITKEAWVSFFVNRFRGNETVSVTFSSSLHTLCTRKRRACYPETACKFGKRSQISDLAEEFCGCS